MNVIRLIAKDVKLQRNFLGPLLLLELVGFFLYAVQMPSRVPGVAFGLLHGMALIGDFLICYRTMIAEEKNRAFLFIKALPVSTTEIVIAKIAANLLLVGANTALLLALWGVGHRLDWIQVRPGLTPYLFVFGLTVHWLNNAVLVTISLVFTSERAVWALFPAMFAVMTVLLNFHRIETALHLEPLVELLRVHQVLIVYLVWATIVALAGACTWTLKRKRVFS